MVYYAAILDEKKALKAVKRDGDLLSCVPDSLKSEALCLAAVKKFSYALQFVPDSLKTEAICLAAVKRDASALQFVLDLDMFKSIAKKLKIKTDQD